MSSAATAPPPATLDDQLKFYLMARGIPEKEAEALLIQAFAAEVVEAIEHEGVRDALMEAIVGLAGAAGMKRCIRR